MKLYIKNMVCSRCKTTIKTELDKLGIQYISVEIGEVTIRKKLTSIQHHLLNVALEQFGFELINNEKNYLNPNILSVADRDRLRFASAYHR